MDPALIAQLIVVATNVATQVLAGLSEDDAAAVRAALEALDAQVDALHAQAANIAG